LPSTPAIRETNHFVKSADFLGSFTSLQWKPRVGLKLILVFRTLQRGLYVNTSVSINAECSETHSLTLTDNWMSLYQVYEVHL